MGKGVPGDPAGALPVELIEYRVGDPFNVLLGSGGAKRERRIHPAVTVVHRHRKVARHIDVPAGELVQEARRGAVAENNRRRNPGIGGSSCSAAARPSSSLMEEAVTIFRGFISTPKAASVRP